MFELLRDTLGHTNYTRIRFCVMDPSACRGPPHKSGSVL